MKINVRTLTVGIWVGLLTIVISSCDNGPDQPNSLEQWQTEVAAIDSYLDASGSTAIKNLTGVRMVISKLGKGVPAHVNSTVNIDYVGMLFSTNTIFDQGNTKLQVSQYIEGWQDALTTLPAGSQARLFIPSLYAYGTQEKGSIPANSTLIFDIKFNDVIETAQELQQLASDTTAIYNYLNSKSIQSIKDTLGFRYVISQQGNGVGPTWYDQVKFKSTYRLLTDDANVVATVDAAPNDNNYNRVIDQVSDGIKMGLQKLGIGSKATFYIPSGLAFGTQGAGNGGTQVIPPNANIIVEIELTEIIRH